MTRDRDGMTVSAPPIGDADARVQALDPSRSFIVQAPAGSGKTELLIQRFLVLLAVVERPEEVLAITFTRKAAGEMKRRVLDALARARRVDAGEEPAPEGANEQMTLDLARRALSRNAERGWRIEENTARLRIQTIDGLCASLTRQMPVLARFGAQPRSVEDARELHREAAHRTLALLESGDLEDGKDGGESGGLAAQVARVLEHLDNNAAVVEGLIATMLARRDQWLRTAGSAPDRDELEAALVAERARVLGVAAGKLPHEHARELAALGAYAAANLEAAGVASPMAGCRDLVDAPSAHESGAAAWAGLAALLLTRDGEWRKKIDKRGGFPAGDSKSDKPVAKAWKDRHAALCAALSGVPGLREALADVQRMPPARYTEAQWSALSAIVALLPMAAAQLKLVFAERGEVDFTEVAQGAVRALGEPDAPTDLLLSFDVRLRHILVDEFQDTSISQFELIERLTAGWQGGAEGDPSDDAPESGDASSGDGRTLFLVGDPMQSIYRFREAEVALFLRARRRGLGSLQLAPLTLATNFRSQVGVIDWVNGAFARIFPPADDEQSGAVGFAPSAAFHPSLPGDALSWHVFTHDGSPDGRSAARESEARRVARLVREARAEKPDGSVAILVRSRTHLAAIVPALKAAGLAFRAIDIEQLHEKQVVQDLLALTRALAHPGDRVAWLACLRAPWCGLALADLLVLGTDELAGSGNGAEGTARPAKGECGSAPVILDALADEARLARLSADGRARVLRVRGVFAVAFAQRMRGALRDRVEGAWLALGGPACVESETELEDAAMFLDMLDTLDEGGDVADPALLEEHLDQLYALPDLAADASLQVMTIHKSKGLEFDTVILPGLDRGSRQNEPPLLQWKLRRSQDVETVAGTADGDDAFRLLLAPIKEAGEASEPIGSYLARLGAAEEEAESARLLYVAVTRAAQRLHLLAAAIVRQQEGDAVVQAPPARSLLARCWAVAEPAFVAAVRAGGSDARATAFATSPAGDAAIEEGVRSGSWRLPSTWAPPALPPPADWPRVAATRAGDAPEFEWVSDTLRHVGTVVHRWLQRMADDALAGWDVARIEGLRQAFRRELAARGVAESELASAVTRVRAALVNALDDPRGRWLLGPQQDGRNETRITCRLPGARDAQAGNISAVTTVVIDRSFRDADGRRWIVDYKTSHHEGAGVEAFLDREQERYREQLQRYAMALAAPEASLGLYFPLLRGWREWGGGA